MAKYTHLIPCNIADPSTPKIAIFNPNGTLVGTIPLGGLTMPQVGEKLYSFGALSDVHFGYDTAEEDFQRALTYLNADGDVEFICICGDLTRDGTHEELTQYKNHVEQYSADTPVYAISGNHEAVPGAVTDESISPYTGQPLFYSFTSGNDVFIMCGYWQGSNGNQYLFSQEKLQWLYETLEANRNKRCFVFFHVFPWGDCGNPGELYWYDMFTGTPGGVFQSLLRHYKNTVFFHGHSHTKFDQQKFDDKANYSDALGYRSVHIPSVTIPRDIEHGYLRDLYEGSEGYVVDVYENGIHLRGRDFVKGEFLPIASYWLDTAPQSVEEKAYWDRTGTIKAEALVKYTGAELIEGWNLTPTSANGQKNASYFTFKYIPIEPGTTYYAQYGTRSWYLDGDKNALKTVNIRTNDTPYQFTAPENAYYISIAYNYETTGSSDNVYIKKVADPEKQHD